MTFRSLYRLERRGLLQLPDPRRRGRRLDRRRPARTRPRGHRGLRRDDRRREVFERFAARLSYLSGDFADPATFERVAQASTARRSPVFYLEIPPALFGMVVKGLAGAGLTENARVVVEKPFGHDLASARALQAELRCTCARTSSTGSTTSWGRSGSSRSSTCDSPTRSSSRSGTATTSSRVQITMAEDFGVDDRGHFYDPVGALRDVVVNHLMQVVAAVAMEPPAARTRARSRTRSRPSSAPPRRRPRALRARPARGLPRDRRRRPRLADGDLRRAAPGHRQLALVGRAVLHPHRQVPAGDPDRGASRLPPPAAAGLPPGGQRRPEPTRS